MSDMAFTIICIIIIIIIILFYVHYQAKLWTHMLIIYYIYVYIYILVIKIMKHPKWKHGNHTQMLNNKLPRIITCKIICTQF